MELGVEFIESAHKQPFGRILHARVARALRQAVLSAKHVSRLRERILAMLVASQVPHLRGIQPLSDNARIPAQ